MFWLKCDNLQMPEKSFFSNRWECSSTHACLFHSFSFNTSKFILLSFHFEKALVATMIQPTLSHNVISLPEPYDELRVPHMLYSDPHDLYHSSHIPHSSQPPYIDPQLDLHPVLFNPNVNPYPTLYNKPKRPRLFDMRPEDAALLGLIDQPPQVTHCRIMKTENFHRFYDCFLNHSF